MQTHCVECSVRLVVNGGIQAGTAHLVHETAAFGLIGNWLRRCQPAAPFAADTIRSGGHCRSVCTHCSPTALMYR